MRALIATLLLLAWLCAGAQSHYTEDAGVVRRSQRVYAEDSVTVREIQRIYVEDSGVVRLVFANIVVNLSDTSCFQGGVGSVTSNFRLQSDGFYDCGNALDIQYVTPTSSTSSVEVFATLDSGTCTSGTFGAWLALSTTRLWTMNQPSTGSSSCVVTVDFRHATSLSSLGSFTVTINANSA